LCVYCKYYEILLKQEKEDAEKEKQERDGEIVKAKDDKLAEKAEEAQEVGKKKTLQRVQLHLLRVHRYIAAEQRIYFANTKLTLKPGQGLLLTDAMKDQSLPLTSVQTSRLYFSHIQYSINGTLFFYNEEGEIRLETFTFLSYIRGHDGHVVRGCSDVVFAFTEKHGIREITAVSDNGPPYHTGEWIYHMLVGSHPNISVHVSFFGEVHGKSEINAFFGRLSMLLAKLPQWYGDVVCLEDIVSLLNRELNHASNTSTHHTVLEFNFLFLFFHFYFAFSICIIFNFFIVCLCGVPVFQVEKGRGSG
jgi:hypothetical protein